MDEIALVGLGANLPSVRHGPPLVTCIAAVQALTAAGITVVRCSRWFTSAPVPASDQPPFVNGVVAVVCRQPPFELLQQLHGIEAAFGRVRGVRDAARVLDLDLLAYGERVSEPDAGVHLPHPRLHERAFVLRPLADVAPTWRHPRLGMSTMDMLARLPPGQVAEPIS